ncbi:sigma-54-dependent Fis family transcriptional regulator [Desulfohalobiaceae bacterium Ax17]|uniref:sigma-54-dependent transcriptional regulator n=1 Tax=Desulfovulcanus ferrireducens TaxID=2831190 RepID=UPI0025A4B05A|nr:sigma-54 dependent transcriptional regulator [Desulfovulcanus ferrireducens]MBT8763433.1 sigma-54-dependent Fis family transcriptional regulator [Desulfovulcanus ferrireducens]
MPVIQEDFDLPFLNSKNTPFNVALVDDEVIFCKRIRNFLLKKSYSIDTFLTGKDFLHATSSKIFDLVFLDLNLPDINGLKIFDYLRRVSPETNIVIITGYGSVDSAVRAMKEGAVNYLCKPVRLNDILLTVSSIKEQVILRKNSKLLQESLKKDNVWDGFIACCADMQNLLATIKKVAPLNCTVLLQGDTGTGKRMVAQAIHGLSDRRHKKFVSFNCGAFSEELIANELFGHEKGAFTGAVGAKTGLLEAADKGTVFLDEIGEMPLSMQVKLLHVIEEKRILRLGSVKPIELDIRIIAATNRDLRKMVQEGSFREDLFFRLNVVTISLPRLTDRKDDIPLLIAHFIDKYNRQFSKNVASISPDALTILMNYDFPGNVRELENIIQRAIALSDTDVIMPEHLPADIQHFSFESVDANSLISLEEMEKRHIARVLELTGYDRQMTSAILGLPRTTLWRKMKKYGL